MNEPPPEAAEAVQLVRSARWAALATVGKGGLPLVSMVAYAVEPELSGLLMFLSRLARHTRNLESSPFASLGVAAPDRPDLPDPQTLPRVGVQGVVERIDRTDRGFQTAWALYSDRLPAAAPRLQLGDFTLYRLVPSEARYVGGFGAARTIKGEDLRRAAAALDGRHDR